MLKKIIVLLLIILSTGYIPVLADKLVTFTDFVFPDNLLIFDNLLYITEDAVIFQYSMKDFALNKKFGREGEGPREFFINWKGGNDMIMISIHDNQLVVNSWGKLTYFTKEGNYVME